MSLKSKLAKANKAKKAGTVVPRRVKWLKSGRLPKVLGG